MKKNTFDYFEAAILLACLATAAVFLFSGCGVARNQPGRSHVRAGEVSALAMQSENPLAETTQTVETDTVIQRALSAPTPDVSPEMAFTPGQLIETRSHKKISTTIGASQKDMAQEISAKLASVRWLQWLGVGVALFGIASLTYPPLRLIVASVTTGAACIAAGAAMIFLPLIIVGHEVLILGASAGLVGLWFLAHRHGSLSGQLNLLKSKP